tara:strand:- start:152 stop:316 length:165 start_codon:yes stop_codon:yes gene_type:complete
MLLDSKIAGQVLFDDLAGVMKAMGFSMWEVLTVLVDLKSGRLLPIDVIFFRELS